MASRIRGLARTAVLRPYIVAKRRSHEPTLSVVMPVYNVGKYLREAVESVLGQSLTSLELIAVDDGSTDGSLEILREFAARDFRVTVLSQANSGQGIARNNGVAVARGEFLTFCDSDDVIPPDAYRRMVESLRATGSDFAVGAARRFSHQQDLGIAWGRTVHRSNRLRTTLAEFPDAMQDIIACNRMFRTRFWTDRVVPFRGQIAYEDHVPMLCAYVRAEKFDVLSDVTYRWRIREDRTSTGQQKASLENLLDRIAVKEEAHELLRAEADDTAYDAWVARVLDVDFPPFIAHALHADDTYRHMLTAAYRTFLGRATPRALTMVSSPNKIRGWLVAESRWEEAREAADFLRLSGRVPPTRVVDGAVVVDTEAMPAFVADLPQDLLVLATHESNLETGVAGATWDEGRLAVRGFAIIRGLDSTGAAPDMTFTLQNTVTGETVPVTGHQVVDHRATIWANHRFAAYDQSGFRLTLDVEDLVAHGPGLWAIGVSVTQDGVVRSGRLDNIVRNSGARRLLASTVGPEGLLVTPELDGEQGFSLRVERPRHLAVDPVSAGPHLLTVRVPSAGRSSSLVAEGRNGAELVATRRPDGAFAFTLPRKSSIAAWSVFVDDHGTRDAVRILGDLPASGGSGHEWRAGPALGLQIVPSRPEITAHSVELLAEGIAVEVSATDVSREQLQEAHLVSGGHRLPVRACTPTRTGTLLTFGRTLSVLGGPVRTAPSGPYTLEVELADGRTTHAQVGDELLGELPRLIMGDDLALTLSMVRPPELRFVIGPPLADDERGTTRQVALQREYSRRTPAPVDAVLFQCYRGEFATDSQRALDERLSVLRPELTRCWGVQDHATVVPEGAVPVVIGSRAWYDALTSSRYLCTNVDFDAWFTKDPHQKYLQTFHGHPFKSMGASLWRREGLDERGIRLEIERRNRDWDTILVPSESCAEYYRTEFDYQGVILAEGYPRSDFLVTADRDEVRVRVLERLGVDPGKTVVLYAPTNRDNVTAKGFGAARFHGLDLEDLSEKLGDRHVILLRGHDSTPRVSRAGAVVDVTDYPEINELTLAADIAVLDYSSLRFDWAITGKPMLFFVPDREEYFAARPPLFDYRESAPGPLLGTTREVAGAILDIDAVAARHAPEIEAFNDRFNAKHDGKATDRVIDAFFTD